VVVNPQLLFQMNGFVVFFVIIAILVLYTFRAYIKNKFVSFRVLISVYGVAVTLLIIGFFLMWQRQLDNYASISVLKNVFIGLFVSLLVSLLLTALFFLVEDIVRVLVWITHMVHRKRKLRFPTRSKFFRLATLMLTCIIMVFVLYGTVWGFSHYKIHDIEFRHSSIPQEFDGFTIVHISDTHLGTFGSIQEVKKGLDIVQQQQPDMIVFTGDMVNNVSEEAVSYISLFANLHAPFGKFAVLGNHDYAHYAGNLSDFAQKEDVQKLRDIIEEMGFSILENSHSLIAKDTESIVLAGVENWGMPPFPQYGNISKALEEVESQKFIVLLSHDPSHWRQKVVRDSLDIPLTLSGHTHGMQFGFEIGDFKWSPIQYRYTDWAGLYEYNNRYLYVNRGFGGIGFPARIGIRPEISVITLWAEE
jgi:predicted MPP superfamily phosphohydrolase